MKPLLLSACITSLFIILSAISKSTPIFHFSIFSLFNRGRVGFTVVNDKEGKPAYVTGLRGAEERNVMRYYLGILAYLDTLGSPADQRFEKRLALWYDLTTKYKRQLFEMDKDVYLTYKRNDENSRRQLQKP